MITLKELEALNYRNDNETGLDPNNMTNRELADFYLEYVKISLAKNTYIMYNRTINNFIGFINADYKIAELQPYQIALWIDNTGGNLKGNSKRMYLSIISSFLEYLEINGFDLKRNPVKPVLKTAEIRKSKNKQYTPISIPDIRKIMQSTTSPRNRAIIGFLFKTGCRIGEVVNLQLSDVDMEQNIIYIRNRKSHHKDDFTMIPIDSELSLLIRNYLLFRPKGKSKNLFVSYYGDSMLRNRFQQIVKDCGMAAGIGNTNPHQYRYSFTTAIENSAVVRYLRGDSAKNMAEYYTKLDFETKIRPEYLKVIPKILST